MILAAAYGCSQVRIDFSVEYFIGTNAYVYDFFQLNDKYFRSGFATAIFVDNPDLDSASRATQLELIEFEDRLQRCYGCEEQWFKENTLGSWYRNFNRWVSSGECFAQRSGIKPFEKIVPTDVFYTCLWEYLESDNGQPRKKDLILSDERWDAGTKIDAYKLGI